jgi:hypothetical protein
MGRPDQRRSTHNLPYLMPIRQLQRPTDYHTLRDAARGKQVYIEWAAEALLIL